MSRYTSSRPAAEMAAPPRGAAPGGRPAYAPNTFRGRKISEPKSNIFFHPTASRPVQVEIFDRTQHPDPPLPSIVQLALSLLVAEGLLSPKVAVREAADVVHAFWQIGAPQ